MKTYSDEQKNDDKQFNRGYEEAEKAIARLCNICHQLKPCPMEVAKTSSTALKEKENKP